MKLARVVGNVVSSVKEKTHCSYKFMIIEYIDIEGIPHGARQIAFDGADAGIGDFVLVNIDAGAAKTILEDRSIIVDLTICGVIDNISVDGETRYY
jgi:microcompartment protein CcmK/EutM